jgi:hypothetical protein
MLRRTTRFTATATDRADNVGRGTLVITVESSFAALEALTAQYAEMKLARTLGQLLANARRAALRGVKRQKDQQIAELVKQVTKERGRGLTREEADLVRERRSHRRDRRSTG